MKISNGLRIERLSLARLSASTLEAWRGLHAAYKMPGGAFLSVAYASAVQRSLGVDVQAILLWRNDHLVGVLPLQRQPGWLGRFGLFEPVGGEMTDYFGLLALDDVQTSWQDIMRAADLPCLYFTHLDETQQRHGLEGEQPRTGLRTVIHPEGGKMHWEWLRSEDKKLVSDTERRERKLSQDHGDAVFELYSSQPALDLDALIDMKNDQYRRTGRASGPLLKRGNVQLLQTLLAKQESGCQPVLSTLKVNGELVAAHMGLLAGLTLHYWFPVYDERYARYSPGRILMRHVLNASADAGIGVIDRGEGDTLAKRDFSNSEHRYLRGLVHKGIQGAIISSLQKIEWRLHALRKIS